MQIAPYPTKAGIIPPGDQAVPGRLMSSQLVERPKQGPRLPMQTYDLTLKELLMDGAPVLLQLAAGIGSVRLAPLEVPVVGGGRLDLSG